MDRQAPDLAYPEVLIEGRVVRRYKRFFVDVDLADGTVVTAHCANTGSMRGCIAPGALCRLWRTSDPKRKLQWTLEQIQMDGHWIMVHTGRPNRVIESAIRRGGIPELQPWGDVLREQRLYSGKSRIDLCLVDTDCRPPHVAPAKRDESKRISSRTCFIEVKNATLYEDGRLWFPDSVTSRGTKHLGELIHLKTLGVRAVLCFHVGHEAGESVQAAQHIDPDYSDALHASALAGVECIAYRVRMNRHGLTLGARVPVLTSPER